MLNVECWLSLGQLARAHNRAVSNWRISLITNDGYDDIVNAPVAGTPNTARSMPLNYAVCVIELSSVVSAELTVL